MSYKYSWTVTSKYYYDQTLTTDLLKKRLADMLDSRALTLLVMFDAM